MIAAIDSNVLIRLLLRDDEAQYARARDTIINQDHVAVSLPVLCETYWVLTRAAKLPRDTAAEAIAVALTSFQIIHDRQAVAAGFALVRKGGDFADGIIAYQAQEAGASVLYTFDKAFAKKADPAVCRVELLDA